MTIRAWQSPAQRARQKRKYVTNWLHIAGCWIALCLCCFGAYQQLFSTFAAYDDEGYVMLSLDGYRQVGGLYDRVFSQYGPAYFVLQSAFHDLTQLPVAHDVSRLRTLTFWVLTCGISGAALWRMTRSAILSTLAAVMMFQHLDRLALEPGHPQEWCVLLMALTWLASTFVFTPNRRVSGRAVALIGMCCGTLGMIKPNLGVLLSIAVTLALVHNLQPSQLQKRFYVFVGCLACALPWIIARSRLSDPSALRLVVVTSASTWMVLVKLWPPRCCSKENLHATSITIPHLATFIVSCGCMGIVFALCAIATGTSISRLINGLVLQHAAFGDRAFFRAAPLPEWGMWWVLLMIVLLWCDERSHNVRRWLRPCVLVIIVATAIAQVFDATRPLEHGTFDRSLAIWWIALVGPAAWIVCSPHNSVRSLPINVLVLTAVLQPFGAYPVPGTQLAIGSILLVAVGWYGLHLTTQDETLWRSRFRSLPSTRFVAISLVLLTSSSVVMRDVVCTVRRFQYESLNLPGTSGLRLPAEQVHELRWMVSQLRKRADTFVFRAHTRGSLYYWTRLSPPTWCNATCWPYLLRDDQQQEIIAALDRRARVCAVDEPYSAPLPVWTSPLLKYLDERFIPVAAGSYFRINERREE